MYRVVLFMVIFVIGFLASTIAYAQEANSNNQEHVSFVQIIDRAQLLVIRFFPVLLAICTAVALLCLVSICRSMVNIKRSCENNLSKINEHIGKVERNLLIPGAFSGAPPVTIADLLQKLESGLERFECRLIGPNGKSDGAFPTLAYQLGKMNESLLEIRLQFKCRHPDAFDRTPTIADLLGSLQNRLSVLGSVDAYDTTIVTQLRQISENLSKIQSDLSGVTKGKSDRDHG